MNRPYVSSVQVNMAESLGVEGRGMFYDRIGAVRDVVQYHLLRLDIDSRRWAGVRFFVHAGRALAATALEAVVELRIALYTALGRWQQAHERLLDGDARRFAREDMVEQAWRVVERALVSGAPVQTYPPRSWVPAGANGTLAGARWHRTVAAEPA